MNRTLLSLALLIASVITACAQDFNVFTDVNLVLSTERGMIGRQYLTDFIEAEELEKGETLEQAEARIHRGLFSSLRRGLNEKSKDFYFGEYPNAKYEMSVCFVKCNSDGQHGNFIFTLTNKENGKSVTFDKSCRGGTYGSRLHLLRESIEGAGEKAATYIKRNIKNFDIE